MRAASSAKPHDRAVEPMVERGRYLGPSFGRGDKVALPARHLLDVVQELLVLVAETIVLCVQLLELIREHPGRGDHVDRGLALDDIQGALSVPPRLHVPARELRTTRFVKKAARPVKPGLRTTCGGTTCRMCGMSWLALSSASARWLRSGRRGDRWVDNGRSLRQGRGLGVGQQFANTPHEFVGSDDAPVDLDHGRLGRRTISNTSVEG